VVTQSRRKKVRIRAVALTAAGVLAVAGVALASAASAQPSGHAQARSLSPAHRSPEISVIEHSRQTSPIKHIVVLYLENHSFDSILGFWCNNHPGRCPEGGMPASVKLSNGVTVTPVHEPDIVPNVDHTVASQKAAIDGGKMDGWNKVSGCMPKVNYRCVGGYNEKLIPNALALASKFAISDNTFSMGDSPSWGGHLYAVMGSLDNFTGDNPVKAKGVTAGPGWGCNSDKVTPWRESDGTLENEPSCIPDFNIGVQNGGAFRPTPASYAPTIMDRLSAAGLSWKLFGDPDPEVGGKPSPGYIWDVCPSFAECLDTSQTNNNVQASTFVSVAKAGNLPAFSLVTPGGADAKFSEHNGTSMTAGDDWLGQVANAIMTGPEWDSTALFITWDDCGCFYDQVPPGDTVPPSPNPDGTQRGPRSPLIIVSPFARPAFTDSTLTTFAGILAFVEHTFGLSPLGPNDSAAYDFSGAFNFSQKPLSPAKMVYRKWPKDAYHLNQAELRQDT
jgi:phospholipase C